MFTLSPMTTSHGPGVHTIQRSIYPPDLHESLELVVSRALLYPAGSLVAHSNGTPTTLLGYCSSYPWPFDDALSSPPSLGHPTTPEVVQKCLHDPPNSCLFVHEVSVYQQGQGLGRSFMDALIAQARSHGFKGVVLVSVLNNEGFYSRNFGFHTVRELPHYGVEEYVESAHVPPLPPTPSYFSTTKTAHGMALLLHQ